MEAIKDFRALAPDYGLSSPAVDRLERLVELITSSGELPVKWRREGYAEELVAESLSGLELDRLRKAHRVVDVGSGAGFPGLVLAVALPATSVTLLDKHPIRSGFLRRAIAALDVVNAEVVQRYAQRWPEGTGAFDVATSRNADRPQVVLKWIAPLLAAGGAAVLWRGPRDSAAEEAAAAAAPAAELRLAGVRRVPFRRRSRRHLYVYLRGPQPRGPRDPAPSGHFDPDFAHGRGS